MNKKGFTLIELIVTIALIGFVGIILSINMIKTINDQDDKNEAKAKELVSEAACAYASMNSSCDSGCNISGTTLIDDGLIDEKINGIEISGYNVAVTYVNGERICEVN